MTLRDLGYFLRGRLNQGVTRFLNARRPVTAPAVPAPLDEVLRGDGTPLALARLVEGRSNSEREAAVAAYLMAHGVDFARHRFANFEGRGENFSVDLGTGDRVLVLIAHHDAVPGSPGANDNAAAVGILLHLLGRLGARVPPGLRVRVLFTAAEELGYLGARAYVRDTALAGVVGVLSLELCGIGDSLAVWDVAAESPFLRSVSGALDGLGLRRDDGYHVVGRIPVFGSDHRAFTAAGIPAYGLTVVPAREAEALRRFVLSPARSAFRNLVRRPPPFDTYHTSRDGLETLEAPALQRVAVALEALVDELG
ncbi:MAG: M28 family peptidase [Candidatus Rokuibacteriota bacterium]